MILDILCNRTTSIPYAALLALKQASPDAFILETSDHDFDWQAYVHAGSFPCTPQPNSVEQSTYGWSQPDDGPHRSVVNGSFDVLWDGETLGLLQVQYATACGSSRHCFIVAETEALARRFFAAVCRWNTTIREEVYVFQEGFWSKDAELYKAIQSSRLEHLILPPGLKDAIRDDVATYFTSRDRYRQFNVPWKRGLILIGPPGNGKTHMIQGLINDLGKPCLYVKSLKARYQNEDQSIREVFEKARESAPCILVLEDIDALVNDDNRSFFLNELDGFRKNDGLLTIATTNHPDKLDPAIMDRPSRFDRKYHFELPATAERAAYLHWWNRHLDAALRLTDAGLASVAAATEGFSFAYLKELALASTMAWMNRHGRPMDETMATQLVALREQMASVKTVADAEKRRGIRGIGELDAKVGLSFL